MSAWIVSKNHIHILVQACYKYEIPLPRHTTPDTLGARLWKENHKSVNYRYNERSRTPTYVHSSEAPCFDSRGTPLGSVQTLVRQPHFVFHALCCYDYQTCEHPTWETSQAWKVIDLLRQGVLKSLGMTNEEAHERAEWDKQPWSIY